MPNYDLIPERDVGFLRQILWYAVNLKEGLIQLRADYPAMWEVYLEDQEQVNNRDIKGLLDVFIENVEESIREAMSEK